MNKLWLGLLLGSFGCTQTDEISVAEASKEMCECFSKQHEEDIDTRMKPCMDLVINNKRAAIEKFYSQYDSEKAMGKFITIVSIDMVSTCDSFGAEITAMYENSYPLDTSSTNIDKITALKRELKASTSADSAKARLHRLVYHSIQARQLDNALVYCRQIKSIDKNDAGSLFSQWLHI